MDVAQSLAHIRQFLAAGKLREAEALCRLVLAAAPDEPQALHQLGLVAIRSGHLPQGVELMQRATARLPENPKSHLTLTQPLMAIGRQAEAEQALRNATRFDPAMASARMNLGALLAQQNRLPE